MKKVVTLILMISLSSLVQAADFPRTLFVENNLARTLSFLNLEQGLIQNDVLELGVVPNQIISYRDKLFALNSTPPSLMVIDPRTLQVTDRMTIPGESSNPYFMALVGARRMYVTLLMANQVAVLDLSGEQEAKLIDVGAAPQGIYVDNHVAIVTNTGGYPDYAESSVSIIDTRTDSVTMTLPVPTNPQTITKGPDFNYYILCSGKWGENQGKLVVLNLFVPPNYTPAIIDTIEVGGFPGDVVVTPDGMAYMTDWGDASGGFLYKVNIYTKEVLAGPDNPIRIGRGAMRFLWDAPTSDLYVSAFDMDAVQKLDVTTDQVTATYPFGDGAQDMAIVEAIAETDPWADEVVSFTPGDPWSQFGYDFFPFNVLGPPDPSASINERVAANSEDEILSLGHGGEIVLKFTDNVVMNGEGVDFIVFENVFINMWTQQPWMEAGIVSVSQDGENFVQFPYDTTTHEGLAGVTPVKSTTDPTNPEASGADAFDLDVVGMDWIRYVKITDMGDLWQEGPYNGDFDLDAVVAVHSAANAPTFVDADAEAIPHSFATLKNYPNPFNPQTTLQFELSCSGFTELAVFDVNGKRVKTITARNLAAGVHQYVWDGTNDAGLSAASGLYLAKLRTNKGVLVHKMTLIR